MGLVFSFLLASCGRRSFNNKDELSLDGEGGRPFKLLIPKTLAGDATKGELQVFLSTSPNISILGDYKEEADKIIFEPLVPFTPGLTYLVKVKGKTIGQIEIDTDYVTYYPEITAVYPGSDTVPENLLKFYIEFNKGMKEGESLNHIALVKNGKDTLSNVFLDLQPELWNKYSTVLTVWFDPGRIKRDLQPNLAMGPPLSRGNKYTLIIKKDWPDVDGFELKNDFKKEFVVIGRDSLLPDPSSWNITVPKAGKRTLLLIRFNESLDYMVLKNAIHLTDGTGKELPCKIFIDDKQTSIGYQPDSIWRKGDYYLEVESRLEDLAANNLEHPFDNDITQKQNKNPGKGYKQLIRIE